MLAELRAVQTETLWPLRVASLISGCVRLRKPQTTLQGLDSQDVGIWRSRFTQPHHACAHRRRTISFIGISCNRQAAKKELFQGALRPTYPSAERGWSCPAFAECAGALGA
jgi:hypothetical protein